MGQRQPGVQGHDRHLDGESGQQCQEHHHLQPTPLGRHGQRMVRQVRGQGLDVERHGARVRGVPEHDRQQAQEREHAAGQCVDEEFHRCPAPLLVPPDADQEEQRDERELEEHVEQDHVPGREHAEHRRLEHEQQHVETDGAILDRVPADEHGRQREQGRQAEHPQREAVEAEREAHVEDPLRQPGQLHGGVGQGGLAAGISQIAHDQPARQDERHGGGHRRALSHGRQAPGTHHPGHERPQQRRGDDQQQVPVWAEGGGIEEIVHGWSSVGWDRQLRIRQVRASTMSSVPSAPASA